MSARATTPLIRHVEDWRAIISLNAYRGLIAFGMVALLLLGTAQGLFDVALPDLFRLICLAYLAQCALAMAAAMSHRPQLRTQVLFACAIDVIFFVCLAWAGNGVGGGLGMLLVLPLAAAGVLLPARLAGFLAACAAIGMLGQEALRPLQIAGAHSEYVQAGILGALFFIVVYASHLLALRARAGEALAAERASEVRDLAEVNRRVIQQMEVGAIVVDARRRVALINDAAVRLLELPAAPSPDAALAEVAPTLQRALDDWLASPGTNVPTVHVGGNTLLPIFSRLESGPNAPVLVFLEDALRQSEQAQQLKLISIGRLTARIAHEIRNPLGAISHAGQLLAESGTIAGDDVRLLEIIHRHTRRIDAIITNVLGLSRRGQSSRQRLALADWLAETVEDYREYNDQAPQFTLSGLNDTLEVAFDPGHLRQVLFNLWDNAQRYARRDDSDLQICLAGHFNHARRLCLDVRDNGPGLDPETTGLIMEPFYTTAREGTGLGLHIAHELCEANGARLLALAETGGACFRIVFAHARPDAVDPAMPIRTLR